MRISAALVRLLGVGAVAVLGAGAAYSQTTPDALVASLRQGGYVLVMRHASSPRETPDQQTANPDNLKRERQLDETGRNTARAMGEALARKSLMRKRRPAKPRDRCVIRHR